MEYAVIMAGGTGKRLWPLSRKKRPKQVLRLLDGKTLLQQCYNRLSPIFKPQHILVLTNKDYVQIVRKDLPELPPENVIAEPAVRDTSGAIGLAATILNEKDPDATMAVVTADQVIDPAETLQQALKDGIKVVNADNQALVTFGIKPTFAATQYGYIKCIDPVQISGCQNEIYSVEAFKEKPDAVTADKYLKADGYFWNAGLFVWKAGTILGNLRTFLPDSIEPLARLASALKKPDNQKELDKWFLKLPKISIDFAVMEKAENVRAIRLDCKWKDIGAFEALAEFVQLDQNDNIVVANKAAFLESRKNIVVTEDKKHLIALIGMENIVVAHTPDATLVCPAGQTGRLKELLEQIEKDGLDKYL